MDTTDKNTYGYSSDMPAWMPQNLVNKALERYVLASAINSYPALVDAYSILTEDCFAVPSHHQIFQAVKSVYEQGNTPDMILVSTELSKMRSNVGAYELAELCGDTFGFDIVSHAHLLREYAMRRKLFSIGHQTSVRASNESVTIETLQCTAKEEIDRLFENTETQMKDLTSSFSDMIDRMAANRELAEGEIFGTPTGFPVLDRNGGLCGSDLIVIGAETSMGKTSFATALALSAIENGDKVAFYSLEMTSTQLAARILSMKSGLSFKKLMYEKIADDEIIHVTNAMTAVDSSKMFFDERSTSSLDSILMSIRAMKMKHGIKGAVVDYLQLINTGNSLAREQAVAKCARMLKNLAKELDIWIIVLSQLSRNQQNPLPSLSRLRDSGQIEEAADQILLLYRPRETGARYPEPFTEITTQGTAMVTIAKGRNTGTGQFICGFKGENTLFYPVSDTELGRMCREAADASPTADPTLCNTVDF